MSIPMEERRNEAMRENMLKDADIAILCLPDDAARQAARRGSAGRATFSPARPRERCTECFSKT